MIQLRPYQVPGFERWKKQRRLFLAHEPGAGKTYIALAAIQDAQPHRVLVVVPAIVRPMWLRLLAEHFPDRVIGAITSARETQLTKKASIIRDNAYTADWQVVSYDLISEVLPERWDFIICDEAHNLRNPLSQQSEDVRKIFRANPDANALLLSATAIPNEAHQLWCPLDTLFPGWAGKSSRTGDVPWRFKERYCRMELRYGHPYFFGLQNEQELKERIAPYIDRVVQADFASYLPPLFVEPLYSDVARTQLIAKWISALNTPHFGIFTHLRESASKIATELGRKGFNVLFITGELSVEKRDELLQQGRQSTACAVVGTTHALNEGVSLSFLKQALVVEWTTEMDGLLQFIGRFARQDSTSQAPTRVEFLVGPNDEDRMATLRERIGAANSLFTAGRSETLGAHMLAEKRMTEDEFQAQLTKILEGVNKRSRTRGLIEVSDDDDE